MADYMDAVYVHHFSSEATPAQRAAKVHDLFRDHEARLAQPILDYLNSKNSVHLIGPAQAENRAPTIAVQLSMSGEAAAEKLAPFGVMAGGGDFYAVRPLSALGVAPEHGVLRLSFVHYTGTEDVDRLLNALEHIL